MWARYVSKPSRVPTSAFACLMISSRRRVEWKDRTCGLDCRKTGVIVRPSSRADIMLCIPSRCGRHELAVELEPAVDRQAGRRQCPGLLRMPSVSIRKPRCSRTLLAEAPDPWEYESAANGHGIMSTSQTAPRNLTEAWTSPSSQLIKQ